MDEKHLGAVDDHPRRAEVEQIWYELNRLRPEEGVALYMQKDDAPMTSAADRAAEVRAACVALGVHR